MRTALKDEALSLSSMVYMHHFNARDDRPHYFGPGCDIPSADNIGMFGVAAPCAAELGLRWPVSLVATTAHGARSTGIPRIDKYDGHTREGSLVFDETAELSKCPRVQHGTLALTSGYPATDVLEVFQRNRAAGALRFANQRLADHVVFVGREPSLATREFSEVSLSALGAHALERRAELGATRAGSEHGLATMNFSVRVGGDVADTKVNTECPVRFDRSALRGLERHNEVDAVAANEQIGFTELRSEQALPVGLAPVDGGAGAPRQRSKRDTGAFSAERVEAGVIGDSAELSKRWPDAPIAPVGAGNLRDHANGHLRRNTKLSTKLMIVGALQAELARLLGCKRLLAEPISGGIHASNSTEKSEALFRIERKLAFDRQLHGANIARFDQIAGPS